MISSFFSKTKPINYAVLLGFLFLFYGFALLLSMSWPELQELLFYKGLSVTSLLLTVFGIGIIVRRTKITDLSSFAMLFFVLSAVGFPFIFDSNKTIFCNFFLMLAFERLLLLKDYKRTRQKIFDASLWVCIASLFNDWALLFLIAVFVAIYTYGERQLKNWLAPLAGVVTILLLTTAALFMLDNLAFFETHYRFPFSPEEIAPTDGEINFFAWGYVVIFLLIALVDFIILRKKGTSRLVSLRLVLAFFVLGVFLTYFDRFNGPNGLLYTFLPASVFLTNYLETIKKKMIVEIVLVCFVIASILMFVFHHIQ